MSARMSSRAGFGWPNYSTMRWDRKPGRRGRSGPSAGPLHPGTPPVAGRSASGISKEVAVKRLLIAGALAIALPAAAYGHHGCNSYEASKVLTIRGKFKTVRWSNPHGTAAMDWKGKQWTVVLAPTARMEARGLTPAMIATGKAV